MKILLAEDDDGISQIIKYILEEEGHTVFKVNTERDINSLLGQRQIDLILMDVSLNGSDGGKIAEKMKLGSSPVKTPIILMSAHPDLKKLASKVGSDYYLTKPFDISELHDAVERFRSR